MRHEKGQSAVMNGLPLNLFLIYDFSKDDLFCAVLDFTHPAYPTKLISGFQFLCDALPFSICGLMISSRSRPM